MSRRKIPAPWEAVYDDPEIDRLARAIARDPASTAGLETPASVGLPTQRAADITPEHVTWIWPGYIPRGKLVFLEGRASEGKTTLAIDLAARLSCGAPMPDNSRSDRGASNVLYISAEDGVADTLVPRFQAAGADLNGVHFPEGGALADLRDGPDALRQAMERDKVGLVILDPITAMLAGVDTHKDANVRSALAPLMAIMASTGATVIAIRHFKKGQGHRALDAGGGSVAFGAMARCVLMVGRDPRSNDRDPTRFLAVTKLNLAASPEALAFSVVSDDAPSSPPRIDWQGPASISADQLLAEPPPQRRPGELDKAKDFLRDLLADGSRLEPEVRAAAGEQGISKPTLDRAKRGLGIRSVRGRGPKPVYTWALPAPKTATVTRDRADRPDQADHADHPEWRHRTHGGIGHGDQDHQDHQDHHGNQADPNPRRGKRRAA